MKDHLLFLIIAPAGVFLWLYPTLLLLTQKSVLCFCAGIAYTVLWLGVSTLIVEYYQL